LNQFYRVYYLFSNILQKETTIDLMLVKFRIICKQAATAKNPNVLKKKIIRKLFLYIA